MQPRRAPRVSRSESAEPLAIIIGAGPAGLAVGACLSRANVPFTILERQENVGASWRGHYDRLHLHTSKGTSALPFLPFPRDYPRYPSRDQVVEYLESYARTFVRQIKKGRIALRAGVERFFEDSVVFTDGKREPFDAVVFATGFRARVDGFLEVEGLCDDNGTPRRNRQPLPEGLHLCGFSVAATGDLKEIGREAKRIAAKIAGAPPPPE